MRYININTDKRTFNIIYGKMIQALIISEHSVLLFSGIVIGIVSALLATLPALQIE